MPDNAFVKMLIGLAIILATALAIILATAIVMHSNYENKTTIKMAEKGYKQSPDNLSRQQWVKSFRNAFNNDK